MTRLYLPVPVAVVWFLISCLPLAVLAQSTEVEVSDPLAACPGYKASNVKQSASGVTADLTLGGKACDVFGDDLKDLTLEVTYDTGEFLGEVFVMLGEYFSVFRRSYSCVLEELM